MWGKLGETLLTAFNAPLQPLLDWIKSLLTGEVNPTLMLPLWTIIVYIISLFYGLFFMFAGFNFIISGHDMVKRENAKSWIRNVVLMVIFVQGSYFIYSLIIKKFENQRFN
jgi:succinate dehydrogenase hydrophobic anchor subunit